MYRTCLCRRQQSKASIYLISREQRSTTRLFKLIWIFGTFLLKPKYIISSSIKRSRMQYDREKKSIEYKIKNCNEKELDRWYTNMDTTNKKKKRMWEVSLYHHMNFLLHATVVSWWRQRLTIYSCASSHSPTFHIFFYPVWPLHLNNSQSIYLFFFSSFFLITFCHRDLLNWFGLATSENQNVSADSRKCCRTCKWNLLVKTYGFFYATNYSCNGQ